MLSKYKSFLTSTKLKCTAAILRFANQVHSTRKTISDNGFSYFDNDGNFNPSCDSPFKRIFSLLLECFNDLDGNCGIIEISVRNLMRILEDRSNLMWSSLLNEKAILSLSAVYYKEVLELNELLNGFSQTIGKKTMKTFHGIFCMIQYLQQTQLPLFISRLIRTIDRSVIGIFSERVKTFLRSNTSEFLIYAERSKSSREAPGQQFLSLLPCNDLTDVFRKSLFPMRLRQENLSSFVTAVFNSLLHSLLDSILEVRCPFDESGLYRLFRVILHLQEFALSTKKLIQSEGLSSLGTAPDRLLSNLSGWQRAEFAVAVLNNEVFRGTAGKRKHWSRSKDATPVTVTMKNARRRRPGGFLARFCCVPVAAQEDGAIGSPATDWPERDGLADLELPQALHQRMRLALLQRSSQQRVASSDPQQQMSLLLPMLRPSWAAMADPASSEADEDDDMREERRRWVALVTSNTSSARRILDSILWGTWRRSHRGTVFVELKIDVTDI